MGCRLPITKLSLCLFVFSIASKIQAQQLPLSPMNGFQLVSEEQLMLGSDTVTAFEKSYTGLEIIENQSVGLSVLPVQFHVFHRDAHPISELNGSIQRASGDLWQLSTGIRFNWRLFDVQLLPELNGSHTPNYLGFSSKNSSLLWSSQFNWLNQIDIPDSAIFQDYQWFAGQSFVSIHSKSIQLKFSSENKHWGPGKYDALLLSNNAPGFLHFGLSTYEPLKTPIGELRFEWLLGKLKNSGLIPADTSIRDRGSYLYLAKRPQQRLIGAFNISIEPIGIPGLELGFSNAVQQYIHNYRFDDLFGGVSSIFTKFEGPADNVPKQQLQSLSIAYSFFESHAKLYFEWLNQKPSLRLLDGKQSPINKRAWLAGFSKFWPTQADRGWLLDLEFTQLEQPIENTLVEGPGIYTDAYIRHGYTHWGESLGSVLYSGSNRQTFSFGFRSTQTKVALLFQRINNNNDFYFYHFSYSGDFRRNWIDLVTGIQAYAGLSDHVSLKLHINYIYTLNYQWEHDLDPEEEYFTPGNDVEQYQGGLSIMYSF